MGRVLVSRRDPAPVQVAEPEQQAVESPYAKWNRESNFFDPDSDEFFKDAQYEAFIDPTNAPQYPSFTISDQVLVVPLESDDISDPESASVTSTEIDSVVDADMSSLAGSQSAVAGAESVREMSAEAVEDAIEEEEQAEEEQEAAEARAPSSWIASSTPMAIPRASRIRRDSLAHIAPEVLYGTPQSFQMTPPSPATASPRLLSWGRMGSTGRTPSTRRVSVGTVSPSPTSRRVSSAIQPPQARIRVQGFAV